jgi:ppGpp synthetase/RelA/SpoT-type nucleotidyltranferase
MRGPPRPMSMPAGDFPEVFDPIAYGEKAAAAYRERRSLYGEFARCVKTLVDEALRGSDVKTQSVDWRVKTLDSFARKAAQVHPLDPTRPKYETPLSDIKDMAGVRVITFLPTAVGQVVEAVEDQFEVIERDDKFDRLMVEERFGYQSVHRLVMLSRRRAELPEYARFAGLIGEIQVRTILQHAWAEIEHDMQYKAGTTVDPSLRRRFMAVAGMLEIADHQFQTMQDEVRRRRRAATESIEEGRLDRAELTSETLRSYLKGRLGDDRRVGDTNYESWVRVLRVLGFTTLLQLDDCIRGLDADAISRNIWGSRRPQLQRFEGLLLAGMGDYYIEHHPSHALDHFVELRRRWLDRLREHGGPVRGYRPPR